MLRAYTPSAARASEMAEGGGGLTLCFVPPSDSSSSSSSSDSEELEGGSPLSFGTLGG